MDSKMTKKAYHQEIKKMIAVLQTVEDGTRLTAGELADKAEAKTTNGDNIFRDVDTYGVLSDFLKMAKKAGIYLDDSENDGVVSGLARMYGFTVYHHF